MWLVIISIIISSIISVLLSDKIIKSLNSVLFKLGLTKKANISGIWKATFEYGIRGAKQEFTEVVLIDGRFGLVIGNIIPHHENYSALAEHANKKPLRVKGNIVDNIFFTGFWYHPMENHRFHGSFQLIISGTLDRMDGQWIGYSESRKTIQCGKWTWVKIS